MSSRENIHIQTQRPVLESKEQIQAHIELISETIEWEDIGLLTDEDNKNLVVLFLHKGIPVSVLRFCLDAESSVQVLFSLLSTNGRLFLGFYQGHELTKSEITDLNQLSRIWSDITNQTSPLNRDDLMSFYLKIQTDSKEKGRGDDINVETKRQVQLFSHSRCMFTGCGINLSVDELTAEGGNYSYLAHNVGSSERAARGGKGASQFLSNDHRNILLMCDKHHRLIDKIAAADFSALDLSRMRDNFKRVSDGLLEGLKFQPIPVFAVLWPVGNNVVSAPKNLEISQSLYRMKYRALGQLNVVFDNPPMLGDMSTDSSWSQLPSYIERAATAIIQQTSHEQHYAALYAFGMMPALIGLGAKLGNKSQITPMLFFRDSSSWKWPYHERKGKPFSINFIDKLESNDQEVILTLALTSNPNPFETYIKDSGLKHIQIIANDKCEGNDCISSPDEGRYLIKQVHDLLHELKTTHNIKVVHVLPCASNAACMFFGMAIDNYHPKMVIYDFNGPTMSPKLSIKSDQSGTQIKAIT